MKRSRRAKRARMLRRRPEYRGRWHGWRMLLYDQDMRDWYERYTGKPCSISAA